MEYFYNDTLRWSFGFDNPNKAAVLFACTLALCWMLWMLAWRVKRAPVRISAILISGVVVLVAAFLLFKTYSRGGVTAAACALVYMSARTAWANSRIHGWGWKRRYAADLVLLCLLVALFWWTGLMGRSLQPFEGTDASVGNRWLLWQRALQMAVDNPGGFGLGKSGEAYMNWYQPVEMTDAYRTMVSSYLTALVELGWPVFAGLILLAAFGWGWASPGRRDSSAFDVATGLRGAILAFAVAGIFSTTMEEWVLWILPGVCAITLVVWTAFERRPARRATLSTIVAAAVCAISLAAGWVLSLKDTEHREFRHTAEGEIISIGPRKILSKDWTVAPDSIVLGTSYGKLLRSLAMGVGKQFSVQTTPAGKYERMIIAGAAVQGTKISVSKMLVLLAPEAMAPKEAQELLASAPHTVVFVPDIDEDGRADFWREMAASKTGVEVVTVDGVGRQLDWGWDQVIQKIHAL